MSPVSYVQVGESRQSFHEVAEELHNASDEGQCPSQHGLPPIHIQASGPVDLFVLVWLQWLHGTKNLTLHTLVVLEMEWMLVNIGAVMFRAMHLLVD